MQFQWTVRQMRRKDRERQQDTARFMQTYQSLRYPHNLGVALQLGKDFLA